MKFDKSLIYQQMPLTSSSHQTCPLPRDPIELIPYFKFPSNMPLTSISHRTCIIVSYFKFPSNMPLTSRSHRTCIIVSYFKFPSNMSLTSRSRRTLPLSRDPTEQVPYLEIPSNMSLTSRSRPTWQSLTLLTGSTCHEFPSRLSAVIPCLITSLPELTTPQSTELCAERDEKTRF